MDSHQRVMSKLRVSLTDACNFRCFYCMPEDQKFLKPFHYLSVDQIESISRNLVQMGISEIRLTGGEPTLRKELMEIVERLSPLPLKKFGMTTNGFRLHKILPRLAETSLKYINISLDSLNKTTFNQINKTDLFDIVIENIIQAKILGFRVKINVVLMKGINSHEWPQFLEFSEMYNIPVRFIELLRIGPQHRDHRKYYIPADEMIKEMKEKEILETIEMPNDSTSFMFKTAAGAEIGFIASESKPFCGKCSRMRLSATGHLRACLFSEDGISLKNVAFSEYGNILPKVLSLKPTYRIDHITQAMVAIGG